MCKCLVWFPMNLLMKKNLIAFLALICTACSPGKGQVDLFEIGNPIAELTKKNLEEASGLAASIRNPGCLWTLNDSDNTADIFLIDQKADIKLVCKLRGIKNRDWEDIAVGPGPEEGKSYVYVADIGDNTAQYPVKYIYRFEEPEKPSNDITEIEITAVDCIKFRLEGAQKDTESLLLDPKTKDLYVVTKREKPVSLFQLKYPYSKTDTITASLLTQLPLTYIVGASISSDGQEILLKNYDHIYYWKREGNKTIAEILKDQPQKLLYKPEPQGEAIAWARDGSGFFTVSENVIGKRSYLFFYKRKQK